MDYIGALEDALGLKADKEMLPLQPGDVPYTYADVDDLVKDLNYKPNMDVKEGVKNFVNWYRGIINYEKNKRFTNSSSRIGLCRSPIGSRIWQTLQYNWFDINQSRIKELKNGNDTMEVSKDNLESSENLIFK